MVLSQSSSCKQSRGGTDQAQTSWGALGGKEWCHHHSNYFQTTVQDKGRTLHILWHITNLCAYIVN